MSQPRTIALDAMGGDHGPSVVVPGAALSLERYPTLSFIFYGDEPRIRAELDQLPALAAKSRIVHTDLAVNMSDKPSQALRRGKGTQPVARHRGRAQGRGRRRRLGRQHRRLHGHVEAHPAPHGRHRAPRHRRAVADHQSRMHRARRRRQHRRQRARAWRFRADGRRHGARAVPHRAPDRRAAQRRRRGDQGRRGSAPGARLAEEHRSAARLSRLHRGRPDRPGRRRRGRRRRLCRQHRAEDGRRHRQADRRVPARRHDTAPGCRSSAPCWPPAASAS